MKIENFEAFKAAVKTLTERFWGQPQLAEEELPGSERARAIATFLAGRYFGCRMSAVKRLVELIIGEPIPLKEGGSGVPVPVGVLFALTDNSNKHDYPHDQSPRDRMPCFEGEDLLMVPGLVLRSRGNFGVKADGEEGNILPADIGCYRRPTEREETLFWLRFEEVNEQGGIDCDLPVSEILASV